MQIRQTDVLTSIKRRAVSAMMRMGSAIGGGMTRARLAGRLSADREAMRRIDWLKSGRDYTSSWPAPVAGAAEMPADSPLRAFFDIHHQGRLVWKWQHYLDIYHRHFERFRGSEVHVLEVGVKGGGSLEMWREYFGPKCRVYGVDIDESCKQYENEWTRIFIADQADREFWEIFRAEVPRLQIAIDDGGHQPMQQAVTLEELLPHIAAGGVYLCEDVHGLDNDFGSYVAGLTQAMDDSSALRGMPDPERSIVSRTSGFQSLVDSIHTYPFVFVIEKRQEPLVELVAPKRGSERKSSGLDERRPMVQRKERPAFKRRARRGYAGERVRPLVTGVAGIAAFVFTAGLIEVFTDRDWSLSALEWPGSFLASIFLVCAVYLGFALVHTWTRDEARNAAAGRSRPAADG